jgi:hypothetical protein
LKKKYPQLVLFKSSIKAEEEACKRREITDKEKEQSVPKYCVTSRQEYLKKRQPDQKKPIKQFSQKELEHLIIQETSPNL